LGPASAAEGLAVAVVLVVARSAAKANRPGAESARSVLGLAFAAGAAISTVIAVAVGAGAGR
jgi:hypothetical protein